MTLFAASVALLALLVASYTRRDSWLAHGSTAISTAVVIGCVFLSTIETPRQSRVWLMALADQMSPVLGQRTLDDVTAAIEHFSTYSFCNEKERPGCVTSAGRIESPTSHDIDGPRRAAVSSAAPQAIEPASTVGSLEAKKNFSEVARSPVVWLFDGPGAPASSHTTFGFLITGVNVSDETLTSVHGTLKPDSNQLELELALSHELEGETVVHPGARFSLRTPNTNNLKQGGAIFTFRYTFAGRERASIMYFTPTMIARSANRG